VPRFTSLILACLAFLGAGVAWYMSRPSTQEALRAINSVHDFGKIEQGLVSTSFVLINESSHSVRIVGVGKSCDCAETKISTEEIGPSEKVNLDCTWDVRGKRGDSATLLHVAYEGARADQRSSCMLKLVADVIPELLYNPEKLVFQTGLPETKTVRFSSKSVSDLSLTNAYCSQRAFRAEFHPDTLDVKVHFDPASFHTDPGFVCHQLTVETNSQNEWQCRIPITVVEPSPK